jgi:hypothetical protein
MPAQAHIPQWRMKGGERMSRYLPWLLFLAAPTFAQTTTATTLPPTCAASSIASLSAAVADDPDWSWLMDYGARRRLFEPTTTSGVVRCVRSDSTDYFMVQFPNRQPEKNAINVLYDRTVVPHGRLLYQKSRHAYMEVTSRVTTIVKTKPDGTVTSRMRDAFGHPIRGTPSITTQARRRRFL